MDILRTEAEKLRDLLTNRQMPDRATMTLTLGELRAAFGEAAAGPRDEELREAAIEAARMICGEWCSDDFDAPHPCAAAKLREALKYDTL